MKNSSKTRMSFILSGIFLALFAVLIVLVKTVDVATIGPEGTSIGLSHINAGVHEFFGINDTWYAITQATGVIAICLVGEYALIGLLELISRKSLEKVDGYLYCLGGLFVVVGILYVLFEKVVINYRPIIEEGAEHVEASFPSSHTMLVCTVLGSVIIIIRRYGEKASKIKNDKRALILQVVLAVFILLTVIGRLVCGVHWFTDILGGVLISAALLFAFSASLEILDAKTNA